MVCLARPGVADAALFDSIAESRGPVRDGGVETVKRNIGETKRRGKGRAGLPALLALRLRSDKAAMCFTKRCERGGRPVNEGRARRGRTGAALPKGLGVGARGKRYAATRRQSRGTKAPSPFPPLTWPGPPCMVATVAPVWAGARKADRRL